MARPKLPIELTLETRIVHMFSAEDVSVCIYADEQAVVLNVGQTFVSFTDHRKVVALVTHLINAATRMQVPS